MIKRFNEFNDSYKRTLGFKYSNPEEYHCQYVIKFSFKWRISRSTIEDLLTDFIKEMDIYKYSLDIDLVDEDYFNITINFNSYSDNEAQYFMEKIVEFFPEEIDFENISFGPKDDERAKEKEEVRPIGYRRS